MSNYRHVKNCHVFVTPVKNSFEIFTYNKYVRILHTCDRFVRKVDRPELGLVLAQLDIEASLIGKFHSNPPGSF